MSGPATKLIEGDEDIRARLELDQNELELIEHSVQEMESEHDMDRNAALADMRYDFIENVCRDTVVKCRESRERERSEAIDRVVTNKYLALPLFFCIMLGIFYLTFEVSGAFLSDLLAAGIDALSAAVDAGRWMRRDRGRSVSSICGTISSSVSCSGMTGSMSPASPASRLWRWGSTLRSFCPKSGCPQRFCRRERRTSMKFASPGFCTARGPRRRELPCSLPGRLG